MRRTRSGSFKLSGLFLLGFSMMIADEKPEASELLEAQLTLPAGFELKVWSDRIPGARSMTIDHQGRVYVASMAEGKVYLLQDNDHNGEAEPPQVLLEGLNGPNGITLLGGNLYIAETSRLLRLGAASLASPASNLMPEVLLSDLPREIHHGARYLRAGPNDHLFMSLGAPCNVCLPADPLGTIIEMDQEGHMLGVQARGVRNSMGFDWDPVTGQMFFTDNGRDMLGDDVPREELNRIDRPGDHFGFPWCHAGITQDPEWRQQSCSAFKPPVWTFAAHTAPLSVHFYRGNMFPDAYRHHAYIAQHGSWNRTQPDGYRLVELEIKQGQPVSEKAFIEGWLNSPGTGISGRPVDIQELPDGSLLISDDYKGRIYRITYKAR